MDLPYLIGSIRINSVYEKKTSNHLGVFFLLTLSFFVVLARNNP